MNARDLILVALSFVIFLSIRHSAAAAVAVIDEAGDEIVAGQLYYIITSKPVAGVLKHGDNITENQNCSDTIGHERKDFGNGVAVSFHPANGSAVYMSSSLNIKFEESNGCSNSTVWQVGDFSPVVKRRLLRVGGEEGNPGCSTYLNWFRIEKTPTATAYTYRINVDASDVCKKSIRKFSVQLFKRGKNPSVLGVTSSIILQPNLYVSFRKKTVPAPAPVAHQSY